MHDHASDPGGRADPGRADRAAFWLRLIGVVGLVIALLIAVLGWHFVGQIEQTAESSLILTDEALRGLAETIDVARSAVETVNAGVSTAEASLVDATGTLSDVGVLFDEVGTMASEQLPNSIASVRSALPPLITSAALVTEALEGISILGLDVAPSQPIEAPLRDIDQDLVELETQLRAQAQLLERVGGDFGEFSGAAAELATTLAEVRGNLDASVALLDGYADTASAATQTVVETRMNLERAGVTARALVVAAAVLFALAQAAPLYMAALLRRYPRPLPATGPTGDSERNAPAVQD